jgi:hypothetical protein
MLLRQVFMPSGAIGQESSKWFGMRLATGHIMNIETQIKEPSTTIDYWDMISSRAPLTHGCHASEVALIIDFEN